MDFIKNLAHGGESSSPARQETSSSNTTSDGKSSSGFLGGIGEKLNTAAGGGRQSEANEDYLDKGIDFVQERLGQGKQDNESALEQAKDEKISDFIRGQYKNVTGKEIPIKDKKTRLG
ncbi:hypothetical protein K3495_g6101 [Podosphaera aphanis]|nr:hypothetical protein K3495_g6101 [Podosphaera aphanis]